MKTRAELEAKWVTGYVPTEADYEELFGSTAFLLDGYTITAGQDLLFDVSTKGRVFGIPTAISSEPTLNTTGAIVGGECLVIWNSASAISFPSGITDQGAIAAHTPNADQLIRIECIQTSPFLAYAYPEDGFQAINTKKLTHSRTVQVEEGLSTQKAHVIPGNLLGIAGPTAYNLPAKSLDWNGMNVLVDASGGAGLVVCPDFSLSDVNPHSFSVGSNGGSTVVRFTNGGFNADAAASGPFSIVNNSGNSEITLTDGQWAEFCYNAQGASGWSVGKWGGSGGGSSTLSGLDDTTISSPANFHGLVYNSASSKWLNQFIPLFPEYFGMNPAQDFTLTLTQGLFHDYSLFARLDSASRTFNVGDHSANPHSRHFTIHNHEESSFDLVIAAPDGFTSSGSGKVPYTITSGSPDTISLKPGETIRLIRTGGPGTWNCAFNSRNPLGPLQGNIDMNGNGFDNLGGSDTISLDAVETDLTGGAMVALDLVLGGQWVGENASPATSGAISVSTSDGIGAYAYVLYQAATEPTLTGITKDGTWTWDASGINILLIFESRDGYRGRHLGTSTV